MAKAKPKAKAKDPRNQHRGTKLTQLRLRPDVLAELAEIEAYLSVDGAAVARAEAIRRAIHWYREHIRAMKIAGNSKAS